MKFDIIGDQLANFEERISNIEEKIKKQAITQKTTVPSQTTTTIPVQTSSGLKRAAPAPSGQATAITGQAKTQVTKTASPPPPARPTRTALLNELKSLFKRANE